MSENRIKIKKAILLSPPVKERVDRRWTSMEFGTSYNKALEDLIERGLRDWERENLRQTAA